MACKACIYSKVLQILDCYDGVIIDHIYDDIEQYIKGDKTYDQMDSEKVIKIMNEQCPQCEEGKSG